MSGPSEQQYRDAVVKLVADFREAKTVEAKRPWWRPVLIGHGWCTEVHRLAEAALHLLDLGYGHEAQILLRTMFESTISLHWLSQKGDVGAMAVFTEGDRAARAAAQDMEKSFALPQELLDTIKNQTINRTAESDIFRKFQAQCDEIDPKRELYSVYRHLCSYAHPSSTGAFPFIDWDAKPVHLRDTPREPPGGSPVPVTAAMCLVWAGRAFDEIVVGKPRKQFLRGIARDLGLPAMLPSIN
ncbi:DUF5677 domain-containing protein [Streptomyces sp. NPDC088194]|uniref:DUF5677 domain-containing protein n=1 Tax=Streptomyces sp. NPDC088194 TaxID=3154931 RepID=UPI00344BBAE2